MVSRSTWLAPGFRTSILLLWWLVVLVLGDDIHVSPSVENEDPGVRVQTGDELRSGSVVLGDLSKSSGVATREIYDSDEQRDVSLCLLMIVRDEEFSLRENLPLWLDVADCFVIGVDDRTSDATNMVIQQVLGDKTARFVFTFTFMDFAQARNAVLRSTAHNFPDTSHIIVADADWRPDLATVDKSELDFVHGSFPFLVWDHSGHTSRLMGWLHRFDKNLRFKYRIHEVLDASASGVGDLPPKVVGWEVRVVESDSNWNANLHMHSRSFERFKFDLEFLELEYEDDPTDLHTLFYLGITKFAYIESLLGKGTHKKTPELQAFIADGMSYFRQAVDLHGEIPNSELVWGSKRWLSYGYHYFVGDSEEAEKMYKSCIEYDRARIDCLVFLSRLYLDNNALDAAWDTAKEGLVHRPPAGQVMTYFYTFECFLPTQAANVISKRIIASESDDLGNDSLEGLLTMGWYLVRHHRTHCTDGVMVDTPEDIDRLESWFEEAIAREALDVAEIKRLTLLSDEESLLALLLRTWGTGTKSFTAWHPQVQQQPQGTQVQRQHEQNQEQHEEQGEQNQQQQHQHHTESKTSDEAAAELARRSLATSPSNGANGIHEEASSKPTSGTPEKASKLTASDRDGRDTDGPGVAPFTTENCGKLVREAWIWLEFDERMIPGVMPSMSAAQVDTAITDIGPVSTPKSFRALLLGGGGVGGGRGGLEHEETLRLVLLLLQLSSTRSEVIFAHPDSSVVEAVRSVTSGCANELGIAADGHIQLDFMYSTLADSIRTIASGIKTFDYVDIGGPLSSSGGGNSENARSPVTGAAGVTVLNPETLTLLGRRLAPGAHLRAWAFAKNPSTELAFCVAAPAPRDRSRQAVETPTSFVEGTSTSRAADTLLLGKILTTTFQVGRNRALVAQSVGKGSALQALTEIETDAEEAWVRQVLAGGDRLSIPDVAQVLADGGFELSPMRVIEGREETASSFSHLMEMEEELLEEGLSRWDIADYADSLKLTPTLVHQVFAVWRGDGSSAASSETA